MKHMKRKPMLPLILLVILVLGSAFMAYFRADIDAGWAYVDDLYQNTQIEVELVADGGGYLNMFTHKDMIFRAMPEVLESYTLIQCPFVLRDGSPLPPVDEYYGYISTPTTTIHGTNNIGWLSEYWNLDIQWASGPDNFRVENGVLPCLVQQQLLDNAEVQIGDTIYVSPGPYPGCMMPDAPEIPAKIAGVYDDPTGRTGARDIIVPEAGFMEEPKLMYCPEMMNQLYYRAYALKINPDFNREYDRIEDELEGFLYDLDGYSFVTNADALEKAARPLIQKLQMQEMLVLPLGCLLCAAAVVIAVLLGLSMELEVFLRLMWGEKRLTVFLNLLGLVCLWLMLGIAGAWGAGILTAGPQWGAWGAKFCGVCAVLSAMGCGIALIRACWRNLIKSYQSRESE